MHPFLRLIAFGLLVSGTFPAAAADAPKSPEQLKREYVDWRFGMFIHFGIETFTGDYWSSRTPPDGSRFTLASVDCKQWAAAAKSAGMTFAVLTTKHHYGFCLWDTKTTSYSSMSYGPKKDIVREYVDAFRAAGLKPGFYFSMLDAKNGVGGSNRSPDRSVWESKRDLVLGQLRELMTNYGEIPMLVFDGFSWQSGHTNIPMQEIRGLVKSLQPDCLISDHNGQTEPWDEDVLMFEEPLNVYAPEDNIYAGVQGQTINGHWFWANSTGVRATSYFLDHLNKLQPRYTNFLLNCPPNRNGVLDASFVSALADIGKNWTPMARPPLPAQSHNVEFPVSPLSAKDNRGASAWNAIDGGNNVNSWLTWTGSGNPPQSVTLDLGTKYYGLDMLTYFPRQDKGGSAYLTTGNITGYKISVSDDNQTFTEVSSGTWKADKTIKWAEWTTPASGRYVRLEATSTGGNAPAVINEVSVGGRLRQPSTSPLRLADRNQARRAALYDAGVWKGPNQKGYTVSGRRLPLSLLSETKP